MNSSNDIISRKKFLLASGAAGAATLLGSAPPARAAGGSSPAYLDAIQTFTGEQTFSGPVHFKSGQPWVDVKAFGAKGDGVTPDDAAIQKAIDTVIKVDKANGDLTPNNPTIFFPPGDYLLNASIITANNASNFCLMGAGRQSSRFVWSAAAPAGKPMLQCINPTLVYIKDLGFIGGTKNPPSYGVQFTRSKGEVGGGSTLTSLERVFFGGPSSGGGPYFDAAVGYTADPGQDQNDDNGTFNDISIRDVKTGIRFGTYNGLVNKVIGGVIENCEIAVDTVPEAGNLGGGSYTMVGTRFLGNKLTFRFGQAPGDSTNIFGIHAGTVARPEGRLIDTPVATASQSVVFTGGHAILADPGEKEDSIHFHTGAFGLLEFHGFRLDSPSGVTLNFPGAAPINFYGGTLTTKKCLYGGPLQFHGTHELAASPVFTPVGPAAQLLGFGYNSHLLGAGPAALNLVAGPALGAGATATGQGSNVAGVLTLSTTTGLVSAGNLVTVNLTANFPKPPLVLLSAGNAAAAGIIKLVYSGDVVPAGQSANSIHSFSINLAAAAPNPAPAQYIFQYLLVG